MNSLRSSKNLALDSIKRLAYVMFTVNIYKGFYFATIAFGFLAYWSGNGVISYGPMLLFLLLCCLSVFLSESRFSLLGWFLSCSAMPFSLLALMYHSSAPFEGKLVTKVSILMAILPLLVLTSIKINTSLCRRELFGFYKLSAFFFLIVQLAICAGQLLTYRYGFGFPVSEFYVDSNLITGTYNNPNDLAAVVLVVSLVYVVIEAGDRVSHSSLFWIMFFSLILLTASRASLVVGVFIFLFRGGLNNRLIIYFFLLVGAAVGVVFFMDGNVVGSGPILRSITKLSSISSILTEGISSDNSMSLRIVSYLHFVTKLPVLGLGSMELNDYYAYSSGASFDKSLMFQNPHSLVVEVGYWLGWLGLFLLFLFLFCLFIFVGKRRWFFFSIFVVASSIPSSVLGDFIFFAFFILAAVGEAYYGRVSKMT
ncbi:O-antigen ligase family protein [Pseudomonas sp. DNDY-54]|uniref:O-antigen ligase family protein n=1 Tax=Pseudomonas sp. DNDY-54 TaxID=2870860 RepID=UPI001CA39B7E|nr:O-antigen ligase family protein [Pseudomonas sp. DNDY-54]